MIKTPRLKIGPLTGDSERVYAMALYRYRNLQEVAEFQEWAPESVAEVDTLIKDQGDTFLEVPGRFYQWGIFLNTENAPLIGDFGVCRKADQPEVVEFGISLDPDNQSKGYASEALWYLLDYLFTKKEVYRVIASVDPNNWASMQLMERVGFRQEAHHIRSYPFKGGWADDVVFALLSDEWPAVSWEEKD